MRLVLWVEQEALVLGVLLVDYLVQLEPLEPRGLMEDLKGLLGPWDREASLVPREYQAPQDSQAP